MGLLPPGAVIWAGSIPPTGWSRGSFETPALPVAVNANGSILNCQPRSLASHLAIVRVPPFWVPAFAGVSGLSVKDSQVAGAGTPGYENQRAGWPGLRY